MKVELAPIRCVSCGSEISGGTDRCSRCAASPPSRRVRVVGVLMIFLGAVLSIGASYLLWLVSSLLSHARLGAGAAFTGTQRDVTFAYALLGAVLAVGIASLIAGTWQAVVGRRNILLSGLVLLAGFATIGFTVLYLSAK